MIKSLTWWDEIRSYLTDVLITSSESVFGNELYLILRKGKLQLCTEKAVYSYEERYYNFKHLFEHSVDLSKIPGHKVLILGLGLGSIIQILENINPLRWTFAAVEIDPSVCELANDYVLHKIQSPVDVVIADAEVFMQTVQDKYDLICVDIFIEDIIPGQFKSMDFLDSCKRALNPDGVLIFNTPAFDHRDREESRIFFGLFKEVFTDGCMRYIHRNYMLISDCRVMKDD